MRRSSFVAALAAVAAVSPLSAQTWQAIPAPGNTNAGAYWNNTSDDNSAPSFVCNAGAIFTGVASANSQCTRQAPANVIPLSPTPLPSGGVFLANAGGTAPTSFRFAAGTYTFAQLGRLAGNLNTTWGIIGDFGARTWGVDLTPTFSASSSFAIWIREAIGAAGTGQIYTSAGQIVGGGSTTNQQFAVFTAGATAGSVTGGVINALGNTTYYVGMEDNTNGGRGFGGLGPNPLLNTSDRDYNDILISVTAVPEPATVGLMGFGLLALAGVAKRRNNKA